MTNGVEMQAGFVGQTAPRVRDLFNRARGGILFVDEAYGLVDRGNGFANEAITVGCLHDQVRRL